MKFKRYAFVRKTAGSALLDVALLMSNVSQLTVLCEKQIDYTIKDVLVITLVSLSMFLQLLLGFTFIYLGKREFDWNSGVQKPLLPDGESAVTMDKTKEDESTGKENVTEVIEDTHHPRMKMASDCLIFVILVVNIFISGIGIGSNPYQVTPVN